MLVTELAQLQDTYVFQVGVLAREWVVYECRAGSLYRACVSSRWAHWRVHGEFGVVCECGACSQHRQVLWWTQACVGCMRV